MRFIYLMKASNASSLECRELAKYIVQAELNYKSYDRKYNIIIIKKYQSYIMRKISPRVECTLSSSMTYES